MPLQVLLLLLQRRHSGSCSFRHSYCSLAAGAAERVATSALNTALPLVLRVGCQWCSSSCRHWHGCCQYACQCTGSSTLLVVFRRLLLSLLLLLTALATATTSSLRAAAATLEVASAATATAAASAHRDWQALAATGTAVLLPSLLLFKLPPLRQCCSVLAEAGTLASELEGPGSATALAVTVPPFTAPQAAGLYPYHPGCSCCRYCSYHLVTAAALSARVVLLPPLLLLPPLHLQLLLHLSWCQQPPPPPTQLLCVDRPGVVAKPITGSNAMADASLSR